MRVPMVAMWMVTGYCYSILRRNSPRDSRSLWRLGPFFGQWRSILGLFLPAALLVAAGVYLATPRLLLDMPKRQPLPWAMVMLLYPVLSVVPQTIIYRAFIFTRYAPLFPSEPLLILASGLCFSWLHIVLRNPIAPLLTLPAGFLFAWRFSRTRSIPVSALEHALYGCLMFTIGLGAYFRTGPAQ